MIFWEAYPRKAGNKQKALQAFKKADVSLDVLLEAIEAQKNTPQWQKDGGQFIPYPTTWLNGRRWEDEISSAKPTERQIDDDEIAAIRRLMGTEIGGAMFDG